MSNDNNNSNDKSKYQKLKDHLEDRIMNSSNLGHKIELVELYQLHVDEEDQNPELIDLNPAYCESINCGRESEIELIPESFLNQLLMGEITENGILSSQKFWKKISSMKDLSREFILKFQDDLNWDELKLSNYFNLKITDLENLSDKVNWNILSLRDDLTIDFIDTFQDKLNWDSLTINIDFTEEELKKYSDKINWKMAFFCQINLTEDLIKEQGLEDYIQDLKSNSETLVNDFKHQSGVGLDSIREAVLSVGQGKKNKNSKMDRKSKNQNKEGDPIYINEVKFEDNENDSKHQHELYSKISKIKQEVESELKKIGVNNLDKLVTEVEKIKKKIYTNIYKSKIDNYVSELMDSSYNSLAKVLKKEADEIDLESSNFKNPRKVRGKFYGNESYSDKYLISAFISSDFDIESKFGFELPDVSNKNQDFKLVSKEIDYNYNLKVNNKKSFFTSEIESFRLEYKDNDHDLEKINIQIYSYNPELNEVIFRVEENKLRRLTHFETLFTNSRDWKQVVGNCKLSLEYYQDEDWLPIPYKKVIF